MSPLTALTQQEVLRQPASLRNTEPADRAHLAVTYTHVDGQFVVLSRFGDVEWQLESRTTNTNRASSKLRFNTIPAAFRESIKAIFYRYIRHGRNGVRPPTTNTIVRTLAYVPPFLAHLNSLGINSLAGVTQMACASYVQRCKDAKTRAGKPLAQATVLQRLLIVELLYELSHYGPGPMPAHPWPETSATRLAGFGGISSQARFGAGKTPIIPDDVFSALFQRAWSILEHGSSLLDVRDRLDSIQAEREAMGQHVATIARAKHVVLEAADIEGGLEGFNARIRDLRTACYIVLASVSGCRNHELAFVQSDACVAEVDDEGNEIFWMRSTSTKTGAGQTRWMIPAAGARALELMTRWAVPYQAQVRAELALVRKRSPVSAEITELEKHVGAVFLGASESAPDKVRTLSIAAWNLALKRFALDAGLSWNLATHQFRRKFANYAARSKFGDLRYLREHFKHWSMDMTLGYALNGYIEMELYLDIEVEYDSLKEDVAGKWLDPDERLSGGYGASLATWRNRMPVTLFKNRAEMIRSIAQSTAIRSNGHAWCTADDSLCVGNDMERTRCSSCHNAVIGAEHQQVYQGLRDHLVELLSVPDIGAAGRARVQRDLDRCTSVLKELGCEITSSDA
jgi:hypothetical protein